MTTSAQWCGSTVGIVRVERELARRAQKFLGKDVGFCLYDRSAILAIEDNLARDIIDGRIRIDFSDSSATTRPKNSVRQKIRRRAMRNTTLYHLLQRARGRSFTREQILQIQARELTPEADTARAPSPAQIVRIADLPTGFARLDSATILISGGLDWQYKDLRALWGLKQNYGFSYYAIVYDLIAVRSPQFVVPGYVELLTDYFGELVWLADHAMCISQATRQEWLHHAVAIGAEPAASSVFPLGCDLSPSAKSAGQELPVALKGKRFALYVSTIEPKKNHFMLYQAWEECIRTKQLNPEHDRLVFVGREGWATGDLLHEIRTNPLTRDTIIVLHDISDEQLRSLYQSCAFVVFPSMYEGFGLPLTEALGYGKVCVSSNAGALSEIGDDLVMRLDPKDTLAWSNTISRLMSSPSELEGWEARIRETHRPVTWEDAARCFFDAVREPVDKVRPNAGARARMAQNDAEAPSMPQEFDANTPLQDKPFSAAIAVAKAFGQLHDGVVVPDYELLLAKGYRRFLRPGHVVFDVGSHAGLHLAQFLDLIGPSGRAIAFEPIPKLAHELAKRYRDRSNVDIRNIALSDKPGCADFLVLHAAIGMSGFKQRAGSGNQGAERIRVDIDTLDRHAARVTRLDYIKIDIEGAEIGCLRGARETVNRYRPLISVEYGMPTYSLFGNTKMTLFDWARDHGYIPSDLFGNLIPDPNEWAVVCDYSLWDFFLVPAERQQEWTSIF